MNVLRYFLFVAALLPYCSILGQQFPTQGNTMFEFKNETKIYSGKAFPSIRPTQFNDFQHDSDVLNENRIQTVADSLFFPLFKTGNNLTLMARIEPTLETGFDIDASKIMVSHFATGISTFLSHKKFSIYGSLQTGTMNPLSLANHYTDSFSILPGLGMIPKTESQSYFYYLPELRFNADIIRGLNAEAGFGTHFFGNGKRSLILSDEQYPYPYFKLTTDIWKFRYVNLFSWHRDIQSTEAETWSDGLSKFNALHYLSWNATPKLNISIFEAIVCPLYDSLMQRQFAEYNYFLPVVMYRPVDYALGSPDNMLAGLNIHYKPFKNHVFYGQIVFDELFMSEFRADILHLLGSDETDQYGAWVNKQSYQVGWRYYTMFGIENLHGLLEFNAIRPYMYSHRDIKQNYTHLNQPLAHPYGANLYELTGNLRYGTPDWFFLLDVSYIKIGLDSTDSHFGQNIFKPTFDSNISGLNNIPVQYYGNYIGQGIPDKILSVYCSVSRVLLRKYNIWGQAALTYRHSSANLLFKNASYVHLSVQWGMGSRRKGW